MPKINIYLPDELAEAVKETNVPVSAVCQRALEQAARRITAIRQVALTDLDLDDATARLTHFTDRARTALRLGVERARGSGAREVGTEHLLGGVLEEGGNLAVQLLRTMEIDPRQVERELARRASGHLQDDGASVTGLRFGGHAAAALELSVTESTSLGHNYIGCEHLLLGLVTEPDGTAGQVLRAMGADQRTTRNAVAAALGVYRHLQAQLQGRQTGVASRTGDTTEVLAAAIRKELEPLVRRLDQVEARLASLP